VSSVVDTLNPLPATLALALATAQTPVPEVAPPQVEA